MKTKFKERLKEMANNQIPTINARTMRGGMQDRLFRREVIRYGKEKQKENNKEILLKSFSLCSEDGFDIVESVEEPVFKRIRNARGFF